MRVLRRFLADRNGRLGLAGLVLVLGMALTAGWIFPGDPMAIAGPAQLPPFQDPAHWLGTDRLGRDVLAQLFHGARVSLLVGAAAAAMAVGIGLLVGTTAGFLGGWVDEALMRLTEAVQTVPSFVLALALILVLGPSLGNVVLAIGLGAWTSPARVVRAEIMALARRDFVDAYRCMGMGWARIAFAKLLPNALAPVLVLATVITASAILIESALAFLGLGDPNRVSWGSMIADGRAVLRSAWTLSAIPGVAIVVAVLSVSLLGEALTAALDPRRRRR
ncbi:ABC transporter permease [Inquilinus sp. YAF38]|jgi:peptide/nickel transport system permease protein|uniref:ABC transporter permease n=1 Tax=Inquilinus sp. YAF38 TaxID=3233084 RepID=UPI003F8E5CD3